MIEKGWFRESMECSTDVVRSIHTLEYGQKTKSSGAMK